MADRIIRVALNPFANARTGASRRPIDDNTPPLSPIDRDAIVAGARESQRPLAPPKRLPLVTAPPEPSPGNKRSMQSGAPSSNTPPSSLPVSPNVLHSDAIEAAVKGDVGALTVILEELTPGPAVNTIRDEQGRTLLHIAAESANRPLRALAFLIGKGALATTQDVWGETPLSSVMQRGPLFLDCVRLLLKAGAQPNTANVLGRTVFHELIMNWRHGPENAIEPMLEHGLDINQPSQHGVRPLFLVARYCSRPTPVVRMLLKAYPTDTERRVDPNLSSICKSEQTLDIDFGPPLLALARYAEEPLDAMVEMIRHGASVAGSRAAMHQGLGLQGHAVRDHKEMRSLLTRAAEKAQTPMNLARTDHAPAPEPVTPAKLRKDSQQALWVAIKDGDEIHTKEFLARCPEQFAQPKPKGDSKGMVALGIAAKHRQFEVTQLILETLPTLDVNARDKHGMTPLLYAIESEATKVATYLLQKGARPTLQGPRKEARLFGKDVYYTDALDYAMDQNRAPCVAAILKWNKDYQEGKAYDVNAVLAAAKKRETREAVEVFIKSTKLTHGPSVAAHRLRRPTGNP